MAADNNLVRNRAIAHYLRFIATAAGRDRVLRAVQYFARFYAWSLLRSGRPQSAAEPYNVVKKDFGTTRKILRIGSFLEYLDAAALAFDKKNVSDPVLRCLAVGRGLGYAGYRALEMVTLIDLLGVQKLAVAKRLQLSAYRSYMAGLLCSTIACIYNLYQLRQQQRSLNLTEAEGAIEARKIGKECSAFRTHLICDLCDLTIPLSALGIGGLNDGVVGAAATISSLIGIWSQWRSTAL